MSFGVMAVIGFAAAAAVAYLLGSISFAVIFSEAFTKKDVRELGSGNAGMTNVLRTAGVLPGILTFICDFAKAAASASFGMYVVIPYLNSIAPQEISLAPIYAGMTGAIFCMLGHIFPVFFGFRGGKGIMTALGSITVMNWRVACIILAIFLIVLLISKIVSISSIIGSAFYPISCLIVGKFFFSPAADAGCVLLFGLPVWAFETIGALIMASITIYKHKPNIIRLMHGEEKRITVKKAKSEGRR